ncbi:AraC family transcriptional regulator [Pseudorhodobacter ferrugineus]|uniref:AraC family transcriptional regulator n=1 Tax=Pseudorhodobacter ferrugineus TaxID=77008 RepID=UPI0003B435D6|nr:GyrI-like domain-containing protein [Pseudorhodobacter ferrugineus]
MFPVTVKKLRSRNLVGLPHTGDYQQLSDTYAKLFDLLDTRDLTDKTRQMVAIFYDDPSKTAAPNLRSFAAVTAPKTVPCDTPLQPITLPTGPHAVLRFTGPYSGLPTAYTYLYGDWLAQSGQHPSGQPSYEVYINSPRTTDPAELVTEICLPLK